MGEQTGIQKEYIGDPNDNYGFYFVVYTFGKYYHSDRRTGAYRHYLHYIEAGTVKIVTELGTLEAQAGELFYIPMGLPYDSYWSDKENAKVISCGFRLFPEANTTAYALQKLPHRFVRRFLDIPRQIQPDSVALGKFYTFLADLIPAMAIDHTSPGAALLKKIKNFIWKYPNLRIEDLATHCQMSRSALFSKIKELTGQTPHQLKLEVQIAKAKNCLISTDSSIQDVCDEVSFCTTTYFRKVFKEHTGMTPRQFRKAAKTNKA